MASNKGYNLVGDRFGKLVILYDTGKRHPKRGKVWKCQCDCGEQHEATTSHLKQGSVKSCGCLVRETSSLNAKKARNSTKKKTSNVTKKKLNEIPEHLKGEFAVVVQSGKFLVYRCGTIFRVNKRGITKCTISYVGRKRNYAIVTNTINGMQEKHYAHRLIAEAFIPNYENKEQINHIDGNPENNSINNLEWVTAKENMNHAYETGLIDPFRNGGECKYCKGLTRSKDLVCTGCKGNIESEENRVNGLKHIWESLKDIKLEYATERERKVVKLRMKGLTLQQIGDEIGVSKERVRQIINSANNRFATNQIETNEKEKGVATNENGVERVEYYRRLNKLSAKDMAELLNISNVTYRNKEIGKSEFTITEAIKLSNLYEVSIDDLFNSTRTH